MANRGYLPKDNPAVRQQVQALLKAPAFGQHQAADIGKRVYQELREALPGALGQWLEKDHAAFAGATLKGCQRIAEEEACRATLKIGSRRRMSGFCGVRVQDGARSYFIRKARLLMSLAEQDAVIARYRRQIKTLEADRAETEFSRGIHARHPDLPTLGDALAAEGVQYEMVFDDDSASA